MTSTESTSIIILREIKKINQKLGEDKVKVMTSEPVALRLLEDDDDKVTALEEKLGMKIEIEEDLDKNIEDYVIISGKDQREIILQDELDVDNKS